MPLWFSTGVAFLGSTSTHEMHTLPEKHACPCASESISGQPRARIARRIEELEALRSFWSSCPGHRDSDLDLFLTICRTSPDVVRPHVIVLLRGGQPDAIFIGRVVFRKVAFKVGYFNVFKPRSRAILFSYGGLRGNASPANCTAFVQEALNCLKSGEADIAIFDHVDEHSALFRAATGVPNILLRDNIPSLQPHWFMALPKSTEKLYASLSSNQKEHFRRTTRKLSRAFPQQIEIRTLQEPADLDKMVLDIETIASKTYQRKLRVGFNTAPALLDFLRAEAEGKWLRIWILYLAGRPCAFWVGAVYHLTFYSDFLGFDPSFKQHAPGIYLLSHILEALCAEGVNTVDFGFGDNAYKERISTAAKREATLHLFAPNLRGLHLSVLRHLTSALHEPVRALLERSRLIGKVKKVWRQTANKTLPRTESA